MKTFDFKSCISHTYDDRASNPCISNTYEKHRGGGGSVSGASQTHPYINRGPIRSGGSVTRPLSPGGDFEIGYGADQGTSTRSSIECSSGSML